MVSCRCLPLLSEHSMHARAGSSLGVMARARQAVFGSPGTLGWVPGREDAVVLWRMIGGALLALTPWTYSLKVRAASAGSGHHTTLAACSLLMALIWIM